VLHQAGSYGKAAIIPRVGDLKELIEEEGFAGAYFEPGDVDGMADAVERLLTDDEYRNSLGQKNYVAAASLPMEDITEWYLLHFKRILNG
jgi:glycosyltransferase involved in cell wall biosynthesis